MNPTHGKRRYTSTSSCPASLPITEYHFLKALRVLPLWTDLQSPIKEGMLSAVNQSPPLCINLAFSQTLCLLKRLYNLGYSLTDLFLYNLSSLFSYNNNNNNNNNHT